MRAGIVATIRVNPRDCQSVLDLCKAVGMPVSAMTFPALVSLALSSGLETLRKSGALPEPDEFQYLNRLQPYFGSGHRGRKTRIAKTLHDLGGEIRAPVMPAEVPGTAEKSKPPAQQVFPKADAPKAHLSEEQRFASQRLTELLAKQDAVADEVPGIKWTDSDQKEYEKLYAILYPA